MASDINRPITDGLDMVAARALIEARIQLMDVVVAGPESDADSPRRCTGMVGGLTTYWGNPVAKYKVEEGGGLPFSRWRFLFATTEYQRSPATP